MMSIEDRNAAFALTISNRVKNALLDLRLVEPTDAHSAECVFCGAERTVQDHSDKCEWAILTSDEVADAIARGPALIDFDRALVIKRAEQQGRDKAADVILSYGGSLFMSKDISVDEYCFYFAELARHGRPLREAFECASCIRSDHAACVGGTANGGTCTCCVCR